MTIQIGDKLPSAQFNLLHDGIQSVSTQDIFAGRKVLLFAVPGAFTPTCSTQHLPGYVEHMDEFRQRGIRVACLAVNDAFVMQAWAHAQHVPEDLMMLADGNGDFTRALGLDLDGSVFGLGLRARRFALYAEQGTVRQLHVEAPGELRVSTAVAMLDQLR